MNRKLVKNSLGFDNNLSIIQDKDMFNYSVDTILLGNFVSLNNKTSRVLEIGTNNGALSIFVASRSKNIKINAIEIQNKAVQLALINIKENNLEKQIEVTKADFKEFWKTWNKQQGIKFQVIMCNPPFYQMDKTKTQKNVSIEKLIATHEIHLNLEDILKGSSKIIEQKGFLSLVLPVERLVDCFELMRKYKFEPKRVQFVYPRVFDKPKFALIEGRYNAGWGTHFLPNLYLHDQNNKLNHEYLDEIKKLYKPIKVNE